MDALRRVSRRAMRRATLSRFVRVAGVSLTVALGVALALIVLDRLIGPGVAWWLIVGAAGGAALAYAAAMAALVRRVGPIEAASDVDTALDLKDRLSSAIALSERGEVDPFVDLAVEEAETLAGRVDVRRAIPVRGDRWWWTWPVLAAAALGVGIFVPQLGLLTDREAEAARLRRIAQQERAAEELERTTRSLEEALGVEGDPEVADPLTSERLSKLDELRDQLTSGEKSADEARSEAAGVLGDLADRLEREAQRRELEDQAVRDLYEELGGVGEGRGESAVDRLAEAMRGADAEGVKRAAGELEREVEGMTAEERARTAERLEELARELEELSERAEQRAAERRQSVEERLRERGLSESEARELSEQTDEEEIGRELRERGMDEENARRLAEEIAQENRRREAQERASERSRETGEALEETARDVREEPRQERQPESDRREGEGEPREGESRQEQGSEGAQPQPGASPERRPEQSGEPSAEPSQSGEPREGEGRQGEEGQEPGAQPRPLGPEPGQPEGAEPGATPSGPEGEQQGEQPSTRGESREGGEQGAPEQGQGQPQEGEGRPQPSGEGAPQPEGSQPGESGAPSPGEGAEPQPGAQPGEGAPTSPEGTEGQEGAESSGTRPESEDGEGGGPGAEPGEEERVGAEEGREGAGASGQEQQEGEGAPGGGVGEREGAGAGEGERQGLDQLREQFESMERELDRSKMSRERAEEMRRRAEEMIENMSPEERERLERWARDLQRERAGGAPAEGGGEYVSEAMDVRREGADGRVVGEIEAGEGVAPSDPGVVSRREMSEQLAGSLESAERAMEERVVPARYRNVERYFRQALERMEREAAEDAQDVPEGEIEPAEDVDPE